MQQIRVSEDQAGQRLDKYLHRLLPLSPNSFIYKMLRKKNITLNGKKAEGGERLHTGDEVKLFLSEETYRKFGGKLSFSPESSPENTPSENRLSPYKEAFQRLKGIEVLYEDEHVLILNKPAGILTQKAAAEDLSLNEWMIGYLLHTGAVREENLAWFKPSVCNRLDRNTSGLVLCGKTLPGSRALSQAIRDGSMRKFYHTVVSGILEKPCRIEGYLYKEERLNKVIVTQNPDPAMSRQEKPQSFIQTSYRPLCAGENYTYLEVELITGKSHQIRGHLASIGHPVIGDYKYGSRFVNEAFQKKYGVSGPLLHAVRLELAEYDGPLSGLGGKTVFAPLPAIFDKFR